MSTVMNPWWKRELDAAAADLHYLSGCRGSAQ